MIMINGLCCDKFFADGDTINLMLGTVVNWMKWKIVFYMIFMALTSEGKYYWVRIYWHVGCGTGWEKHMVIVANEALVSTITYILTVLCILHYKVLFFGGVLTVENQKRWRRDPRDSWDMHGFAWDFRATELGKSILVCKIRSLGGETTWWRVTFALYWYNKCVHNNISVHHGLLYKVLHYMVLFFTFSSYNFWRGRAQCERKKTQTPGLQ